MKLGALLTFLTAVAFAAAPFLVPQFRGFSPYSFPIPQYSPPVQPADYAFAIWGFIFLWLLWSALFGLRHRRQDPEWQAMRPTLAMSLALGAAWLPITGDTPLLALAMIWGMWLTSIAALFRAPRQDRALAAWPVGLYAGWLSVAVCVTTGLNIAGHGVLDGPNTALSMLFLAITISALIQLRLSRVPTFGLGAAWGLFAIYVANDTVNANVAGLAIGGSVGLATLTIVATVQEMRSAPA